uniref:hypothetical protein n=1 Tax=Amycolatopsis sp. CA-082387 TaxID=3239918 RepID=UPI003F49AC41
MTENVSNDLAPSAGGDVPTSLAGRQEAFVQSVKMLRGEIMRLWIRRGRPSPAQLARAAGVAQGNIETFLGDLDTALPSMRELDAMIKALGEPPAVYPQWRRRLAFLEGEREYLEQARRAAAVVVVRDRRRIELFESPAAEPPVADVDAPLGKALKARNGAEYRAALRLLMENASLSYTTIAENTNGKISRSTAHRLVTDEGLPKVPENVRIFVEGCGATSEQVALWLSTLDALHEGTNEPVASVLGTSKLLEGRWEWVDGPTFYLPFSGKRNEEGTEVRFRITRTSRRELNEIAFTVSLAMTSALMITSGTSKNDRVGYAAAAAAGITGGVALASGLNLSLPIVARWLLKVLSWRAKHRRTAK